jgi:carboxypeptidase PM20D1
VKKFISAIALLFGILAAVIIVRTLMFTPARRDATELVVVPVDSALLAKHLAEAIRFPTVSRQPPDPIDSLPFEEFVAWVSATYPEVVASLEQKRLGKHSMLFTWLGRNPDLDPILLAGHYDVVPVLPGTEDDWEHAPFSGDIAGGFIWGRGALDNKSAVIAILEAATLLTRSGFQPQRTIYFSFSHDEEVGGGDGAAGVTTYLEDAGKRLEWSLDEGSYILDRPMPGVEPLIAIINVAEKGYLTLEIVARAQGGHSSMPPRQTAVGILAEAITKLQQAPIPGALDGLGGELFDVITRYMPFGQRALFANKWLFGTLVESGLSNTPFGNAMIRTTTAPTMLSGSIKENVLPTEAVAAVNFRVHPRDTIEGTTAYVKRIVENENVEVRVHKGMEAEASNVSSWAKPGFELIGESVREVYGDVVIVPGLMAAFSDSRHYGRIADDSYRFNPVIMTAEGASRIHGTNERISIDNLAMSMKAYVRIIRNAAGPGR